MTAVELRSSIVDDLSLMSEDMLRKMSSYGKRLLTRSRKQPKPLFDKPTKIEIDDDIQRLMGRFPIPSSEAVSREEDIRIKKLNSLYGIWADTSNGEKIEQAIKEARKADYVRELVPMDE